MLPTVTLLPPALSVVNLNTLAIHPSLPHTLLSRPSFNPSTNAPTTAHPSPSINSPCSTSVPTCPNNNAHQSAGGHPLDRYSSRRGRESSRPSQRARPFHQRFQQNLQHSATTFTPCGATGPARQASSSPTARSLLPTHATRVRMCPNRCSTLL